MAEEKMKLKNVSRLEGLDNIDFSNGFVCNVETGICGPTDEKVDEEKKNENNHMV